MNETTPLHLLVLYTRIPDYFLQCVKALLDKSPSGSKATIVCSDPDKNAPYKEENNDRRITFIRRSSFIPEQVEKLNPDIVYLAGWGDKKYTDFTRKLKKKIPVVMGLDNPWKGTVRQKIGCLIAPYLQQKYCTHVWAAGVPQYEFARRMGFGPDKILNGLYCADTSKFNKEPASKDYRRILFVGRLVPYKRPDWLLNAFSELIQEDATFQEWKLLMVGNGELKALLMEKHRLVKNIEWSDFTDPEMLPELYSNASVFCLPSKNEHWGVVVHEAAAAGLALLLSDTCAAGTSFLINGYNGYHFKSPDFKDMKSKLSLLMAANAEQLRLMGKKSSELAKTINHDQWVAMLKSVLLDK